MISTTTLKYLHNFGIHGCIFGGGDNCIIVCICIYKERKKIISRSIVWDQKG